MSKESRRPGREEIKELRGQRKKAAKALRARQKAQEIVIYGAFCILFLH